MATLLIDEILNKLEAYSETLDCNLGLSCKILSNSSELEEFSTLGFNHHSIFPISSVSKTLIGMSLLLSKKIDLKSQLDKYVECSKLKKILVEDLINHKSGIPEYIYGPSEHELENWSLEQYCDYILSLRFLRDKSFSYSNSNYTLLSLVIKKKLGVSYGQFVEKQIFIKLKMKNSFSFEDSFRVKEDLSSLYSDKELKIERVEEKRSLFGWGESSFFSTTEDLMCLMVSDLFLQYIEENQKSSLTEYINGSFVHAVDGVNCFFHSGSTLGAESLFYYDPSEKFGLVYLSNHNSSSVGEVEIIPSLLSTLMSRYK